jgi:hypothetical protein
MVEGQVVAADGALRFDCPRCHLRVTERMYGPCEECREQLRADLRSEPAAADEGGQARFEPKMHVVPNHVATKDD